MAVDAIQLVSFLIENNANLDAKDAYGYSPFHVAAINDHLTCAMVLAQNGASSTLRDDEGRMATHIAASHNFSNFLLYALSLNKNRIDFQDNKTLSSPLSLAIECGSDKCVEILLRAGASTGE